MKTRAAVFVKYGEPLVIDEIELADPAPDEVLVRLFATGLCHSHLHNMHRPDYPVPAIFGHEATGVVTAKGRDVTHVREGDRVLVTWIPRDARSQAVARPVHYRFRGQESAAVAFTWAEDILAHEQLVLPLDDDMPVDIASIIGCAVVTGVGAVLESARVQPGETVAVYGVGGVGLNVIAGAKLADAGRIIAVDLEDSKLALARELGATDTINASVANPVQEIQSLTGGGVDYAFDAIGHDVTIGNAIDSVRDGVLGARRGGTAVIIGLPQHPATVNIQALQRGERSLIGSRAGSSHPQSDFPKYQQWYREGRLPLDRMVSKVYESLDDIHEGVRALQAGEIQGRSVIVYRRP